MSARQTKISPDPISAFTRQHNLVMPGIILIIVLAGYGGILITPPLLDEQFLLAWLAQLPLVEAKESANFFAWAGFSQLDFWGPFTRLTAVLCGFLCGGKILVWRLLQLTLHLAMCWLGFFTLRRLGAEALVALGATTLFAVYSLHGEAVGWAGGLGIQLGHLFALAAFFLYVNIREKKLSWPLIALMLALFAWSMSASVYTWVYVPAIVVFELVSCCFVESRPRTSLTDRMIPLLSLVVLSGAYLAGSGFLAAMNSGPYLPELKSKIIRATLKNLVFPVNQATWHRYASQYRLFYFLLAPWGVFCLLSFWRDKTASRLILVSLGFVFFLSLPYFGNACLTSDLIGGRFFYGAIFWWSAILSVGVSSLLHLKLKPRFLPLSLFLLWITLAGVLLGVHSWNQVMAHRNAARHLRAIQKSLREVGQANGQRYVFLGGIAEPLSVVPEFRWRNLAVFDSQTGLLASNVISDGRLKDALSVSIEAANPGRAGYSAGSEGGSRMENPAAGTAAGNVQGSNNTDVESPVVANAVSSPAVNYSRSVLIWNNDLQTAVVWPFLPTSSTLKLPLSAEAIGNLMMPPLAHTPNACLQVDKTSLVINSIATSGPVLTIDSQEFSPLDGDFVVLDAAVTLPAGLIMPKLDVYWQTAENSFYDNDSRKISVPLFSTNGSYRRYEIPLRYAGWYAAGIPKFLTFGFPPGSTVSVRSLELVRGASGLPDFQAPAYAGRSVSGVRYTPPFAGFPNIPELGLIPLSLSDREIVCTYSVKHISGAEAAMLEVSLPNKAFANPNGETLSASSWRQWKISGAEGEVRIAREDLPKPGVYSLRVIALDHNGNYISHFSDALCFQVPR